MQSQKCGVESSVVLVENWIASEENQQSNCEDAVNQNTRMTLSETNANSISNEINNESKNHMDASKESSVNEGQSFVSYTFSKKMLWNEGNTVHKSMDSSAPADTLPTEIDNNSRSEGKLEKTKNRRTSRQKESNPKSKRTSTKEKYFTNSRIRKSSTKRESSKKDIQLDTPNKSRSKAHAANYLNADSSVAVALCNVVRTSKRNQDRSQDSNGNSTGNVPNLIEDVDEMKHVESSASRGVTASTERLFESSYNISEEMVDEIALKSHGNFHNAETAYERPLGVGTHNEVNDCAAYEEISPQGQTNCHQNQLNLIYLTDHRTSGTGSQEYDAFGEFEPRYQFPEEVNAPIDYSIRHCHEVFISPAAPLRIGFVDHAQPDERYLPFPERFHVDEQQQTYRNDLCFPVPHDIHQTYAYPLGQTEVTGGYLPIENQNLSEAANGDSGTIDAYSQTEAQIEDIPSKGKFFKMLMDSNSLNLNSLIACICTVNAQLFDLVKKLLPLNQLSPSTGENNSGNYDENSTSRPGKLTAYQHEGAFNKATSSYFEDQPTEIISNEKKKKKAKGIPMKRRSKRILEMTLTESNKSHNIDAKAAAPTEFEIEAIENRCEDNWVHAAPRMIFQRNEYHLSIQTPKRLSTHMRKKNGLKAVSPL